MRRAPSSRVVVSICFVLVLILFSKLAAMAIAASDAVPLHPAAADGETALGPPPAWQEPARHPLTSGNNAPPFFPSSQPSDDSLTWIDPQDRETSLAFFFDDYQDGSDVDSGWSGSFASCAAGNTSDDFRLALLRRINYFRSMAGIPEVQGFDDNYSVDAQAAALLMSVNGDLSHSPPKSWTCYTASGSNGAGNSNLALGAYGPAAISLYIYDPGGGNYFVGHRRWILYPQTQIMGTGDVPAQDGYAPANALWVFDLDHMWGPRPETRDEFIAWPPPGYVPYPVVYPRWSFAYPEANFSQTTVSMIRDGQPLAVQQNSVENGFGENTLVWEPQ
ncbi:MAG: CAP domain-containing protein, partial [Candidatus Promineifilaceae bacterium]